MIGKIPGRKTLIATSLPCHSGYFSVPLRTAKWTWATEALATGFSSKDINISDNFLPKDNSINSIDLAWENGGT